MRALVVSDIHGNLAALEAVLAEAGDTGGPLLCLGDTVGYGPFPNECVRLVLATAARTPGSRIIAGNHDLAAVGKLDPSAFSAHAARALRWTRAALEPDAAAALAALEPLDSSAYPVLSHGSPEDPAWAYVLSATDAFYAFSAFAGELCLVGHSHVPSAFVAEGRRVQADYAAAGSISRRNPGLRRILNPGSVGFPRDLRDASNGGDGDGTIARYGLLDLDSGTFEFRGAGYDFRETAELMRRGPDAGNS